MDLRISRSFNQRNLRIFESRESEVATQKLTKLWNNPQHRVSRLTRKFSIPLLSLSFCLSLSIIIIALILSFFPFFSFIMTNLLEDHPPSSCFVVFHRGMRDWVRTLTFSRVKFAWLNNDREKDRTFRLKEYCHAKFILLSPLSHPSFSFYHFFTHYRASILLLLLNSFFL